MTTTPLAESYAYCRRLARRTAHNFYFSFLTLPRDRYDAMCALYAFLRIADDLGDDPQKSFDQRRSDLHQWHEQTLAALRGDPAEHPALPAIADLVRRFRVPAEHLFDVLDGIERDLQPVQIQTFREFEDYCYHVAGAVGLCCIQIWGYRDPEAIPLAIECGLAFQWTNILRDVAEDWSLGRVYLPAVDLQRFHYTTDDLAASRYDERFYELMRFEADRTRSCYVRARRLIPLLDPAGRRILRAMLSIYGGLLDELERRQFNVFRGRIALPRWKKLWFAVRAMLSA
uniref:Phytoene/squalene synthase family protein n=1 Tax=Schlesneria paludicola TaxID=360056 RepID=A0A7C2NXN5_9PLAN